MPSPRRVLTIRLMLCVMLSVTAGLTSASGPAGRAAGSWETAGILPAPHEGASATLLADGRVLIVGGEDASGALPAAEIIDAAMHVFAASPMRTARAGHTSTLLADGRVLVTGGRDEDGTALSSVEIFDPATGAWAEVSGGMKEARSNHVAVPFPDGTVLVAGGADGVYVSDTLEIYDPVSGVFSPQEAHLLSPRTDMAASLLDDGRVLFVGGSDAQGTLDTLEMLDTRTGLVESGPSLSSARAGHSLVRLLDGRLLIAGGSDGRRESSSVELYDPQSGSISLASSRLGTARAGHLALLLPDNNAVLFVGGRASGKPVAAAEIYEPWNDRFRSAASAGTGGGRVSGTPLAWSGSVLVAGGDGETAVSLYHYATIVAGPSQDPTVEPITIKGSGWQPGERIDILVQDKTSAEEIRTSAEADDDGELLATASAPAAGAGPSSFLITASGSNDQAQASVFLASPTRIKVNSMGPSSGTCGSTIVVTATLEGKIGPGTFVPLPNETVDFTLGSATGSGVTDANGVATASLTVPQGATSLAAAYAGNGINNPTSQTIAFIVNGSCCTALTVNTQPAGGSKVFGEPASFSVSVTGTAPITYQWRKDGLPIPSAMTASYAIPSVQMIDTGSYDVVIDDLCGTTTSDTAALVVGNASPSLTVASSSNPSVYGDALSFTASVGIAPPGAGAATGTVQFRIDGSDVGAPVPIVSGAATSAPVSTLTAGLHVVSAVYSGDSNVQGGSTSASPDQTVGQASISVTASNDSRVYGAANPSLNGSVTGVQNGDNITATYGTAATPASPVGGYAIVPALVDPDGKLSNYSVTSGNGTLTVTAAPLTVTASDASRMFGLPNPAFTGTITGVQNGDNITATYASTAIPLSPLGSYAIVPTLVDPDSRLSNYSTSVVNGALTVVPAGFMIIDPLGGATLDCSAAPPTIVWTPGAYDKFRVYISWLPNFANKFTSGDKMLRTTSWTVPAKKWSAVCSHASTSIYIKVLGVDLDVRKKDPNRRAFANVSTGVQ